MRLRSDATRKLSSFYSSPLYHQHNNHLSRDRRLLCLQSRQAISRKLPSSTQPLGSLSRIDSICNKTITSTVAVMNKNAIEGKVIFLTGAGSGIGRATALKLSKLGARLALSDLNIESCRETAKQCAGGPHQVTLLNVSEYKRCIETIKDAIGYFGRIDHVFNCAGINPTARDLVDCSEDYFDKLVAVNLKGVYNVTKATIPYLRSGSAIVNVSSICGIHPHKQMAIYCATKYAIIGFSKSMALELGPKGIRVNVVAPGYIETPTNASVVAGEEALKKTVEQVALGRMGKAGEVADVVAFLMGDESRYMNGSVVEVNGGTG